MEREDNQNSGKKKKKTTCWHQWHLGHSITSHSLLSYDLTAHESPPSVSYVMKSFQGNICSMCCTADENNQAERRAEKE